MEAVGMDSITRLLRQEEQSVRLQLPKLQSVQWDLLDYLGWVHPDGRGAWVVRWFNGQLSGMALRRTASVSTKPRYEMCTWCGHLHGTGGTALFSVLVRGTDGRRTLGNPVCAGLDCSLRIRNLCGTPSAHLAESLNLQDRIARLDHNMYRFFRLCNRLDV